MARRKKRSIAPVAVAEPAVRVSRYACRNRSGELFRSALNVGGILTANLLKILRNSLQQMRERRTCKSLRVRETASLGDKRFVAIVEAGGERFLIGGAAASVTVLARLTDSQAPPARFASVLESFGQQNVTIQ